VTAALLCAASLVSGCSAGAELMFELDTPITTEATFFDFPYPADSRLLAGGRPDLTGYPQSPAGPLVKSLAEIAADRPGFPVVPVIYFRFTRPIAARTLDPVIPAEAAAPIWLLDVDPASPDRGRRLPTVAQTLAKDAYVPENVLAVAARPGWVLHPRRTYAVVVTRAVSDAAGRPLDQVPALAELARRKVPKGARAAQVAAAFAPLWDTLKAEGVDTSTIAAATVFTTGDVVADLADLSARTSASYAITITNLAIDPDDGAAHDRFCELTGRIRLPQFQRGDPPFSTGGTLELGPDGLPIEQRGEDVPIELTLPKTPMPQRGYPLVIYFHGSGGVAAEVVDRGPVLVPGGPEQKGQGPAYVLAPFGIAAFGAALPLSPDRLPGAGELAYLNFNNLAAFRDTFRQGVIESRILLETLRNLRIPAASVAGCKGPTLAPGQDAFFFDPDALVAQGQSMGGLYANLVSAVEPRIRAAVPTGAGGMWSYFVTQTQLIPGLPDALVSLLALDDRPTFVHPVLQLLETAWEPADPIAYVPRLARRPLDGHPVRPVYEPVGKDDRYFPTQLYDAMALAYGHKEAGDIEWPTMQDALGPAGLGGVQPYPVTANLHSERGDLYTGVVVQYLGDGLQDPHDIFAQLDAVKYQYGCFLSTFLAGAALVPAPAPLGTPCPH
jgi:hypothetical protein